MGKLPSDIFIGDHRRWAQLERAAHTTGEYDGDGRAKYILGDKCDGVDEDEGKYDNEYKDSPGVVVTMMVLMMTLILKGGFLHTRDVDDVDDFDYDADDSRWR